MESPYVGVPVLDVNPVRNLPVTTWLAIEVELWEPLISPESSPVKLTTSAAIEAINGLLQLAWRRARGYRRFENFRAMAYWIAGRLEIPAMRSPTH